MMIHDNQSKFGNTSLGAPTPEIFPVPQKINFVYQAFCSDTHLQPSIEHRAREASVGTSRTALHNV